MGLLGHRAVNGVGVLVFVLRAIGTYFRDMGEMLLFSMLLFPILWFVVLIPLLCVIISYILYGHYE